VTLKQQIEEYRAALGRFNQWEAEQRPIEREPAAILADLGFILSLIPLAERLQDPDPEKIHIRRMRARLALMK